MTLDELKESTVRSASRLTLCGAIFDAAGRKAQLAQTQELIHAPDFWSQPEKSQKIMQDRKRLEEQIDQDKKISGLTSDLDTLFELAREGENVNGTWSARCAVLPGTSKSWRRRCSSPARTTPAAPSSPSIPALAARRARTGPKCCCA